MHPVNFRRSSSARTNHILYATSTIGAFISFGAISSGVFAQLPDPSFTDATAEAGVTYDHAASVAGAETFTGGAAIADYDGDGYEDIYVTRVDATDILFRNKGDGTFEDVTESAGLSFYAQTNGAAWGDIDSDGDFDLYITCIGCFRYYLFVNDGSGHFTEEAESRGASITSEELHRGSSVTFGDYDKDGWLDIHVVERKGKGEDRGLTISHQRLLRNLGAPAPVGTGNPGHFEDVTDAAGVATSVADSEGFSTALVDLDEDGWLDLAITGDGGKSFLFWNDQAGGFVDGTDTSGCCNVVSGMGAAMGDINGDGDQDWFISAIDQNRLYQYNGAQTFLDNTDLAGVRYGFWGWGAVFLDYDNDGDLDLSLTNGRDNSEYSTDPMRFWENDGSGVMSEKSALVGLTDTGLGMAHHTFDYDRDGDLDLFVVHNGHEPILYRNDGGNAREWLRVRLLEGSGGIGAPGAKLSLVAQPESSPQTLVMGVASQFLGHSERVAHFGLGSEVSGGPSTVSSLSIGWPDGSSQILTDIPANIEILVRQGETPIPVIDVSGETEAEASTLLAAAGFVVGTVTTQVDESVPAGAVLSQSPPAPYMAPSGWAVDLVVAEEPPPNASPIVDTGGDLTVDRINECLPVSIHGSVARQWNEELLHAIRKDFARPTVHARNLYHTSAAMWDAWAAYDGTATQIFHIESATASDIEAARNEAISYAAYRIISTRFAGSPGAAEVLPDLDARMQLLGYDKDITTEIGATPAALGNRIAAAILLMGETDGANETNDYANLFYEPVNPPLLPDFPGNPDIVDPNRWQPLVLEYTIDQSGNPIPGGFPGFLSPEWGTVTPFALSPEDLTVYPDGEGNEYWVYHDPGAPPYIGGPGDALYKAGFEQVVLWSGFLDPADGVMIDISPKARGNNPLGTNDGMGRDINPRTGQLYDSQLVPAGDYYRVLAEFWADGPESETPPGHWFTIANYVSDHPLVKKQLKGTGPLLNDLEWDVKLYLTMGGAMHDSAISAWGIKGWYDYIRPVSAIRYMADNGQSSDPDGPSYDPTGHGITLYPGAIEVVTEDSILPGERHEHLAGEDNENVGKIAFYAWRGPDYILDPNTDTAGVGWILAENWWPYQRPSFVTPPFAGYVSGHSTYSRAAAVVMHQFTGDEFFPGGMGTFFAPENGFLVFEEGPSVDILLEWATYYDASDETSISRIYGGIHPPADDVPGRLIGAVIGQDAFDHAEALFPTDPGGECIAAKLQGSVSDDGVPASTTEETWSVVSGPGTVNFSDPMSAVTNATFSAPGVYELKLESTDGELTSSDTTLVTVEEKDIYLTNPNGGEVWVEGQVVQIHWSAPEITGPVKITAHRNGRSSFISFGTENDGHYEWTVREGLNQADNYTIRVTSLDNSEIYDESDGTITINNLAELPPPGCL